MKRKLTVLLVVILLVQGCGKDNIDTDISDNAEVFKTLVENAKNIKANIRQYENTILDCYFSHSIYLLEANFLGVQEESDLTGELVEVTEIEKQGIYSEDADFYLYSKSEAFAEYNNTQFDSDYIDSYSQKEIDRYNEIAKSMCDIDILYGVDKSNSNIVTQTIKITDIKDRQYFILLRWEGDKCVEISYKSFTYLW